ncbi:MAG: hypothetical protein NVSMB29_10380 [Candidatus Dormibacteria bacterium]
MIRSKRETVSLTATPVVPPRGWHRFALAPPAEWQRSIPRSKVARVRAPAAVDGHEDTRLVLLIALINIESR